MMLFASLAPSMYESASFTASAIWPGVIVPADNCAIQALITVRHFSMRWFPRIARASSIVRNRGE
jgi:hypothetical protein